MKRDTLATVLRLHVLLCLLAFVACETQPPKSPAAVDPSTRIASALDRAEQFIAARQSPDGAWRSNVYGFFKDGPTLTPHVTWGLMSLGRSDPSLDKIEDRGMGYLMRTLSFKGAEPSSASPLIYPAYAAADIVRILARSKPEFSPLPDWLGYLRAQQLNESLGWEATDMEYGGWSYALSPPHKPPPRGQRGPWDWSNISATRYALDALRSAGVAPNDPACRASLIFIQRCQNYGEDPRFDDGGFFFSPADEIHNKAGVAGRDGHDRQRYHSYGSATVDGVAALLDCGLPPSHPRVLAALSWLQRHPDIEHNPGDFSANNEDLRDATYYYYCRGLARLYLLSADRDGARRLADALLRRQRADGSWSNSFTDAREDDPLIATPLAAAALADCRKAMAGGK